MSELARHDQDCDKLKESVFLACDLKKSSYRYAFLQCGEMQNGKKNPFERDKVGASVMRERLIVRLPNVGEATVPAKARNEANESIDDCDFNDSISRKTFQKNSEIRNTS